MRQLLKTLGAMPRRKTAPKLAAWVFTVASCAMSSVSCNKIQWQHAEYYENGQFRVLAGKDDPEGKREGVWLFFDLDGGVMRSESVDGRLCDRTGYYNHGVRVRDLTEAELQAELARIHAYLDRSGQRMKETWK